MNRRNLWASARPSNWSSMTKAERKAWNRANWRRQSSTASPGRTARTTKTTSDDHLKKWVTEFIENEYMEGDFRVPPTIAAALRRKVRELGGSHHLETWARSNPRSGRGRGRRR